jgi:hypothetical protein
VGTMPAHNMQRCSAVWHCASADVAMVLSPAWYGPLCVDIGLQYCCRSAHGGSVVSSGAPSAGALHTLQQPAYWLDQHAPRHRATALTR